MVKITGLTKVFNPGTATEKVALQDVNLELGEGDFVTIVGSNGAGKSTLLNIVAGVFPPSQGSLSLDGVEITGLPEHKRASFVARVFQDPLDGTAASMTVEENLALAMRRGAKRRLRRAINQSDRSLFKERLGRLGLGLETRLQEKVKLLSGGQRQALALLMATLKRPRLLLLDEPTAALDPKTGVKVLELTAEIVNDYHLTTLMVTHDLGQALQMGNRTVMMHEGSIVRDIAGLDRSRMTVGDLLELFEDTSGTALQTDRLLLVR